MAQQTQPATDAWYYDHEDGTHVRGDTILARYPEADTLAELLHDGHIERVSDRLTDDPLAVVLAFAEQELDYYFERLSHRHEYDGVDGVRRVADIGFAIRRAREGRDGTLTPAVIDEVGAMLDADRATTDSERENVLWDLGAARDRVDSPVETVEQALQDAGVPRATRAAVTSELTRQ